MNDESRVWRSIKHNEAARIHFLCLACVIFSHKMWHRKESKWHFYNETLLLCAVCRCHWINSSQSTKCFVRAQQKRGKYWKSKWHKNGFVISLFFAFGGIAKYFNNDSKITEENVNAQIWQITFLRARNYFVHFVYLFSSKIVTRFRIFRCHWFLWSFSSGHEGEFCDYSEKWFGSYFGWFGRLGNDEMMLQGERFRFWIVRHQLTKIANKNRRLTTFPSFPRNILVNPMKKFAPIISKLSLKSKLKLTIFSNAFDFIELNCDYNKWFCDIF